MSESDFWGQIRNSPLAKRPGNQLTRIENSCGSDQPDVEYCCLSATGWIELKHIPGTRLPKRATSIVRCDHYTDGQRLWHRVRAACGGRVWVFLKADKEYFLFFGRDAADHLGIDWTIQQCRDNAAGYWKGSVDWKRLEELLKQPTPMMVKLQERRITV